jgi:hypothetical protein
MGISRKGRRVKGTAHDSLLTRQVILPASVRGTAYVSRRDAVRSNLIACKALPTKAPSWGIFRAASEIPIHIYRGSGMRETIERSSGRLAPCRTMSSNEAPIAVKVSSETWNPPSAHLGERVSPRAKSRATKNLVSQLRFSCSSFDLNRRPAYTWTTSEVTASCAGR